MTKYYIGVLISTILWSLSFIWTKGALESLSPVLLVFFRMIVAFVALFLYSKITNKLQKLTQKQALQLFLLAFIEPVGYFLFETHGMTLVTPTLAAVMVAIIPLFSPIVAYFINKERVKNRDWSALAVSICGVFIVVLSDGTEELGGRLLGVLYMFGAVLTAIIYAVSVQRISKNINPTSIVCYQNIFSIIIMIPVIIIFDFEAAMSVKIEYSWLWRVITLGTLCSAVAFVFYASSIKYLGVTKSAMFINLIPGLAAIASFVFYGEYVSLTKIIGLLITIIGLFISINLYRTILTSINITSKK